MSLNDPVVDVNKDLPLLANAGQIRARHYMFRLTCHMQEQSFHGEAIIFLTPVGLEKVFIEYSPSKTYAHLVKVELKCWYIVTLVAYMETGLYSRAIVSGAICHLFATTHVVR